MAAVVLEIIDVQAFNGQECLNRFHYVDTTGLISPALLVTDYIAHVVPLYAQFQPPSVTHTSIIARQVYPTASLQVVTPISPPVAGANPSGQVLPMYVAYSAQFFLGATVVLTGGFTGHIKRSGMRTVAVNEGDINGDGVASAGIVTAFATFFAQLIDPNGDGWLLCCASYLNGARIRQQTVQSYALITGASPPSASTQNSRKLLRGRYS